MKFTKYYLFFLAGLLIFLSSTAYLIRDRSIKEKKINVFPVSQVEDHSQVIKFDHKFHVKDQGIACADCHTKAAGSTSSKDNLNPLMQDCASCHDVKDDKKCDVCHINGKYEPLKATQKELTFSHKFHVTDQKKKCAECHTGIEQVKYAKESPTAFPPMEVCATCHDRKNATMNCEACHTNLTSIKPANHEQSNFLNEHKVVSDISTKNNCMMCHSDNFCQVCHSPTNYTGNNTKDNFYAPYYTKEGAVRMDREALQQLTTVHNINYQFTHGLDAGQRSYECKTCHDASTFCASCHQNGGNSLTGVLPQSHQKPNFVTMGVNSGGGLHSELARRDIESCQSCHDVQGGDPTCVKCHFDNDGVKGTHPKTHESGFMHDENGIWHKTKGAVCFVCHTDPNARPDGIKGVGFCGYCHGK
jgi:hypothetical protein